MEAAGATVKTVAPVHQVMGNARMDLASMKAALRAYTFNTNTDAVGAVTIAHLHDFAALQYA